MPRIVITARDPLIVAEAAQRHFPRDVPVERRYGDELNLDAVFTQLGVPDLFATQRAVHYAQFMDLKLLKKDGERLAEILARLPAEITLVATQVLRCDSRRDEERIINGTDFQRWASGAQLEDLCKQFDGQRAVKWVVERARERYALALTETQAQRLYELSAESPAQADGELAKLALDLGGEGLRSVTNEELHATLSVNPAARFYELADAITSLSPRALAALDTWFGIEPDTHRLVAELRRRLLGFWTLSQGGSVQPPFFENQLRELAGRWPSGRLGPAIVGLAKLEHGLKSGAYLGEDSKDAELNALELFVRDLLTSARRLARSRPTPLRRPAHLAGTCSTRLPRRRPAGWRSPACRALCRPPPHRRAGGRAKYGSASPGPG